MTQPATVPDAGVLAEVRAALAAAGFTVGHLTALLKTEDHLSSRPEDMAVFERRIAGDGLAATISLLVFGQEVDAGGVDADIARLLERAGLVEATAGRLRPRLRLIPHGDLLIASDLADRAREADADYVTGINAPAGLLADLTIRAPSRLTLDLGCGNGIQSLLASRHSERVIATDVNARALWFTELNCGLNGVTNVETRLGSLYEPVAGERFDLIVSNPPYVISPDNDFLYRDSGMPADAICAAVAAGAGDHLAEGGFAQFLISWLAEPGRPVGDRPLAWVAGRGVDAWLLHASTEDPLTHAAKWNRPARPEDLAGYPAALDRWTRHVTALGAEGVAFGALILRRRDGANWARIDTLHRGRGQAGEQIRRVFAGVDLAAQGPDAIAATRLKLVPEHRLEQVLVAAQGGWQVEEAILRLVSGIEFQGGVDLRIAGLLARLDGSRTTAQAIAGAELEDRESALTAVARLLELGFLERA